MRESPPGQNPVVVEIVAYAPTAYYQCAHCEVVARVAGVSNSLHKEQLESSLPADLASDYRQVNDWVRSLFRMYQDRISVTVIDAASVEGLWRRLRHRIRRYPAVFIGGKQQLGKDPLSDAEEGIARSLRDTRGGVPCSQA